MKTLTFKEKDAMIKDIFKQYNKDIIRLACIETTNYYPSNYLVRETPITSPSYNGKEKYLNHMIDEKDKLRKKTKAFENIISKFDSETLNIIEHEYLNYEPGWWYDYYSKSTYYRNKNRAMNIILEFLVY